MKNLPDVLRKEGYRKIVFKLTKTQHLMVKAQINGVKGDFILDTGASNSCVDFSHIDTFALRATHSKTKAAGAGAVGMDTQIARGNLLKMGRWHTDGFDLVVFDLSHVNHALLEYKAKAVQGIIGADVLLKGEAIIDYANFCLYLK